jgi:hypothetical protein
MGRGCLVTVSIPKKPKYYSQHNNSLNLAGTITALSIITYLDQQHLQHDWPAVLPTKSVITPTPFPTEQYV